jgi:bifunctional non-homologous end joining protein LigD
MSSGGLTRYRQKRDFSRTPEPAGTTGRSDQALSFVVQRHAARRLHYDLRLEWRGVMKSWAVTRGPSMDPADKRLAVEVEDHPLDYASFEGTIPKPSYGGGVVQVWDRGSWAPLDPATVDQDLAKGELKFVLSGERLKGGFVLVRMRPRRGSPDRHDNWLLIKERDSAATPGAGDAVLKADTSVLSGRTLDEISAGDEINAGAQTGPETKSPAKTASAARSATKTAPAKSASATKTTSRKRASSRTAPSGRPSSKTPPAVKSSVKSAPVTPAPTTPTPIRSRQAATAIPTFVPPQLCKPVDTPPTGDAWVHELKLDGYRLQLRVEAGAPILRTRTGLDWTARFPPIAKAAIALPDCLMDGEAVALDAKGHPSFSALQATLSGEQRAPMVYFVFDLLHDAKRDLRDQPLETRKRLLRSLLPKDQTVIRYLDHFGGPGEAVLTSACGLGMEGIVSKRIDAPYRSGRGDSWTKSKCRGRDEFLVGGWTTDKRGRDLGALLLGARRDGKLVYLGKVGTGFTEASRADLSRRLSPLRAAASPFTGRQPARTSDVTWVTPELVVEIAYGGWTEGEGLLRHASFVGVREDKPAADVTSPDPPAREVASPDAPARDVASPDPPARVKQAAARREGTPAISHPDRVLWPATSKTPAVTKADLAAYYTLYADRILAGSGGRPLSIIRAPEGISGQLFFQRHAMRGQSPLIGAVTVAGQAKPYLRIDDIAGLVALAQISVVELHPWGARADTPDTPDRLVFDLDPAEGLDFAAVIDAAIELRDRLATLGLTGFARVTGGKGMHVVVPLRVSPRGSLPGWPEAKQFARLVCVMMERDAPDHYTTTLAKQARGGKIFLDYLRNDRTATAIAAWSPRGRPGAPIARPVPWTTVRPGLDPAGWRLPEMLDAKPQRDPWQDFETAAGDLRDAIGRAAKA